MTNAPTASAATTIMTATDMADIQSIVASSGAPLGRLAFRPA